MADFSQPSFSAGEISPAAYGRVDLAKYGTALKTCRNFLTRVHGGVVNRPGTEFIAESASGRFIPFIFNEDQAYVLDFRDTKLSVISNGGYVLEANQTISIDASTPAILTAPGHGYSNGDVVYITNTNIITLDNQFWRVTNRTVNTFQLEGSSTPGIIGTGTVARVFQTGTPYVLAQLPKLSFTQLRDVMTLAIQDTQPKNLLRMGHANWGFANTGYEDGPFLEQNTEVNQNITVSAISGTATLTANVSTFVPANVGQYFYLEQRDYGPPWEVGKTVAVDDLRRSEGKYYRAADSGTTGTLRPQGEVLNTFESDGVIRWEYLHSGYGIAIITGFINTLSVTVNVLSNFPKDLLTIPSYKWAFGAWGGDQGWPAVVTYFQQRRTFFSTPAKPEYIWMSGTNAYTFYGKSTPSEDDDSLSMQLVSKTVSPARFAIDLGKLIVFTANGKWVIPDDDNNPTLTPSRRSARAQGALGASNVLPAIVEDSIIYVIEKGQTVQDIAYQFVNNAYSGKDLSVLSKHLFEKHRIVAAAYQHVPFQVNWYVRDDGILIGVTYLKEHEVWGWHRHDFLNGFVEDVCVIPEGQEDRVYFKIRRVINGVTKWYTERLSSRLYTDIRDAHFVDSGLKYDGRNNSSITMSLTAVSTGGGGFGSGGFGTGGFGGGGLGGGLTEGYLHTSAPYFNIYHVGDEIHFPYEDRVIKAEIKGLLSNQDVVIQVRMSVPAALVNTPIINWGHAKSKLVGFRHLEGQTLNILADGKVHPQAIITEGELSLQYASVVVVAGLPMTADFETLALNAPSQGSILDKEKCLFAARLIVDESRGIFAGPDAAHLDEWMQRELEPYESPVDLKSGLVSVRVDSTWEPGGKIFVRQSDPLPLSILNVMPDVDIGGAR